MPPVAAPQAAPTSAPSRPETVLSDAPTAEAAVPQPASQTRPARRAGSRAAPRALCSAFVSRLPSEAVPACVRCAVANADMTFDGLHSLSVEATGGLRAAEAAPRQRQRARRGGGVQSAVGHTEQIH